jgi:hypothetical protein
LGAILRRCTRFADRHGFITQRWQMRIRMDESQTLRILDPWTMMYGEYEQEFIEELHREIGPGNCPPTPCRR